MSLRSHTALTVPQSLLLSVLLAPKCLTRTDSIHVHAWTCRLTIPKSNLSVVRSPLQTSNQLYPFASNTCYLPVGYPRASMFEDDAPLLRGRLYTIAQVCLNNVDSKGILVSNIPGMDMAQILCVLGVTETFMWNHAGLILISMNTDSRSLSYSPPSGWISSSI